MWIRDILRKKKGIDYLNLNFEKFETKEAKVAGYDDYVDLYYDDDEEDAFGEMDEAEWIESIYRDLERKKAENII